MTEIGDWTLPAMRLLGWIVLGAIVVTAARAALELARWMREVRPEAVRPEIVIPARTHASDLTRELALEGVDAVAWRSLRSAPLTSPRPTRAIARRACRRARMLHLVAPPARLARGTPPHGCRVPTLRVVSGGRTEVVWPLDTEAES